MSQAHQLTRTNQQALLAHEWPEGWFVQTEDTILLLLPGTGDAAQPELLLQKLQDVGQRMGQTVILSMPFPSLLQLDLDDAAVRNVLRTGCILLEYYQGAF